MGLYLEINPDGPADCTGCKHLTAASLGGEFVCVCGLFVGSMNNGTLLRRDGPNGHAYPCGRCVGARGLRERRREVKALEKAGLTITLGR